MSISSDVLIPSCSGKFYHGKTPAYRTLLGHVLIPSCSGKFYHQEKLMKALIMLVLIPSCSGKFYHGVVMDDVPGGRGLNPFVFREVLSRRFRL